MAQHDLLGLPHGMASRRNIPDRGGSCRFLGLHQKVNQFCSHQFFLSKLKAPRKLKQTLLFNGKSDRESSFVFTHHIICGRFLLWQGGDMRLCMCLCVSVLECVCVCVCMCLYVYMSHTHTCTPKNSENKNVNVLIFIQKIATNIRKLNNKLTLTYGAGKFGHILLKSRKQVPVFLLI